MGNIGIAFFDVDGTLSDMQTKRISEKTLEALRRLRENGVRICIATGRAPCLLPDLGGIQADVFLTCSGALCYDENGIIFSNPIAAPAVQQLIRNAEAIGRPVAVLTKTRLAANGLDADLVQYYAFADWELTVAPDFEEVSRGEVYQVVMSCLAADHAAILSGVEGAAITGWWDRAVDIIPVGGGKGLGVEKILEHYGLERSQSIAFGDGENDMEMLQSAGTGVAMGNAKPALKAMADEVCLSVAEDGVYHYCVSHGLI